MTSIQIALLAALPWVLVPIGMVLRMRRSRTLDEFTADPPRDPPLVSVIVPARNEAGNIARCVRSILATDYPSVELIVVDDQSTDGTGAIAAGLGATVIETPPLPADWFGKQWACWTGKSRARGDVLCFTDADTEHAPDLNAGESVFLALLYPLGAAMALFIYVRAIVRGRNLSRKERDYTAA